MNRQKESVQSQPEQSRESATNSFDFDQWAGAVKQQMIASLKRRGAV